jgi:hypothetical protein
MTSELKLHQSMKHTTIQPWLFPETIFEHSENLLCTITTVVKYGILKQIIIIFMVFNNVKMWL